MTQNFVTRNEIKSETSVTPPWSGTHLYELEDCEGGRAVVAEHEADDAEELSVEAAVAQTEQEAAEQRHSDAAPHDTQRSQSILSTGSQ